MTSVLDEGRGKAQALLSSMSDWLLDVDGVGAWQLVLQLELGVLLKCVDSRAVADAWLVHAGERYKLPPPAGWTAPPPSAPAPAQQRPNAPATARAATAGAATAGAATAGAATAGAATAGAAAEGIGGVPASASERQPCMYGSACYQRNPRHCAQYSHPDDWPGHAPSSGGQAAAATPSAPPAAAAAFSSSDSPAVGRAGGGGGVAARKPSGQKICPNCSKPKVKFSRSCKLEDGGCGHVFNEKAVQATAAAAAGAPASAGPAMDRTTQPDVGAAASSAAASASGTSAGGEGLSHRKRKAPAPTSDPSIGQDSVIDDALPGTSPDGWRSSGSGWRGSSRGWRGSGSGARNSLESVQEETCGASQASSTFRSTGTTARRGECAEDAIDLDESQRSQSMAFADDDDDGCMAVEEGEAEGVGAGRGSAGGSVGGVAGREDDADYLMQMLQRRQQARSGAASRAPVDNSDETEEDDDADAAADDGETEEAKPAAAEQGALPRFYLFDEEEMEQARPAAADPVGEQQVEQAEEAEEVEEAEEAMEADEADESEAEEVGDDEEDKAAAQEEAAVQEEEGAGWGGTQQYFSTQAYTQADDDDDEDADSDAEGSTSYVPPDTALYLKVTSLVRPEASTQMIKLEDGPNNLRVGRMRGPDSRGRFEKQLLDCYPAGRKLSFHDCLTSQLLEVHYIDRNCAEVRRVKEWPSNAVHMGSAPARTEVGSDGWVVWNAMDRLFVSVGFGIPPTRFEDVLQIELLPSVVGLAGHAEYHESGAAAEHERVVYAEAAAAAKEAKVAKAAAEAAEARTAAKARAEAEAAAKAAAEAAEARAAAKARAEAEAAAKAEAAEARDAAEARAAAKSKVAAKKAATATPISHAMLPLLEISGSDISHDFEQRATRLEPDVTYAVLRRTGGECPELDSSRRCIRLPSVYATISKQKPRLELTLRVDAGGAQRVTIVNTNGSAFQVISGSGSGASSSTEQPKISWLASGAKHVLEATSTIMISMKGVKAGTAHTLSFTFKFGREGAVAPSMLPPPQSRTQMDGMRNERKRPRTPPAPMTKDGPCEDAMTHAEGFSAADEMSSQDMSFLLDQGAFA